MRKNLTESTIIFISILIWIILATCVGVIVGASTALFLKILQWSSSFSHEYTFYYFALPFAMAASVLLIRSLAPDAAGHGTERVIEAVHKSAGKIKAAVVPVKLITTIITIAAGGSVGKEGPCAQIGAGLASGLADLLRLNDHDRRRLVICGISAGFASVFGTPIAGAIFGVEVLFMGSILYDVLLPSVVAGMISYWISSTLGVTYFYHPINFVPTFSESFFLKVAASGIFFGICSLILIEALKYGEKVAESIRLNPILKSFLGGLSVVVLASALSTQYLGLGLNTIEATLQGGSVIWCAFLLKIVFTSLTLSFGGSGGIVTPTFFIGATAGAFFATLFGLDIGTFAAIGLTSLLAGAANTPIAASIMAIELFGPQIAPYAAVAAVISFLMTGHRSVYPSQVLSVRKAASIDVKLGDEIEDVMPMFRPEPGGIMDKGVGFAKRVKAKFVTRVSKEKKAS